MPIPLFPVGDASRGRCCARVVGMPASGRNDPGNSSPVSGSKRFQNPWVTGVFPDPNPSRIPCTIPRSELRILTGYRLNKVSPSGRNRVDDTHGITGIENNCQSQPRNNRESDNFPYATHETLLPIFSKILLPNTAISPRMKISAILVKSISDYPPN